MSLVGDELAVLVLQRDRDLLARRCSPGSTPCRVLHGQQLLAADEVQVVVLDHRAGQQVRLAQDLEAVADAEHRQAAVAASTIVAITRREPAIAPARR